MKYAVLDVETTGFQPSDEIIQIGLVLIEAGVIRSRFTSLVKPSRVELPEAIKRLTGIDESMLEGAPELEEVIPQVLPFLHDAALVAHNAAFDLGFLQRALDRCGYSPFSGRVLDTMDFLRILFPGLPSLELSTAAATLGVAHERAHRADSDALATAHLWLMCLEKLDRLPLITVQRLAHLFDQPPAYLEDLSWFFREYRFERERKVAEDPDQARYYRQFALRVGDWGREEESGEDAAQDVDPVFASFYSDIVNRLKAGYDAYETREAQERMAYRIAEALEEGKHLMVEAGTGTGKSLGYLIPAIYYSVLHGEPVVVSTHTINLQEQLRTRDLPLLERIFPFPFRASVLKGRGHYLCLRKFEQKINMKDWEPSREESVFAAQMVVWLSETVTGEDEELSMSGKSADFWHTVASDADSCLNRACPWFRKCFYHRARHRAGEANVIITNHSLLFTDIKAEHRLLPAYRHLVVDEAHQFEEAASRHLGSTVSYFSLAQPLQRLYRDAGNGLLAYVSMRCEQADNEKLKDMASAPVEWQAPVTDIKAQWDELTDAVWQLMFGRKGKGEPEGGAATVRITPDSVPKQWESVLVMEDNLYVQLSNLVRKMEKWISAAREADERQELQDVWTDFGGLVKSLGQLKEDIRAILRMPGGEEQVYWLEAHPQYKGKSLHLCRVPVDVSGVLKEELFGKKDSVVLTSATLSVNRTFDYATAQLGLTDHLESGRLITEQLPSPFNYRDNVLMCIPRDFPRLAGGDSDPHYNSRLVDSLARVAAATKGRMLVLFTSYRMLREVYYPLRDRLAPEGIRVLGQGLDSGNRSKLTRWFREMPASVLLGTSSFWEGVDIPGESLSCLAIVRLPFQPPNHPLVEARTEYLKRQNKNAFMEYSVPQAVIRFKQGFGRLVRSSLDYGVVIVYDTRVIETRYGKHFLYSLPGPKIEHMPDDRLVERIREWLEERGGSPRESAEDF